MNKRTRLLSIIMILTLVITTVSVIGTDDAYAASKKKKAKNIALSATPVSENAININWNTISKPYKGYAVFRDGVAIAHLGKKATSYTDTGLAAGSAHSYQVKTYTVKKVKKNKKKVKKYTYKKKSNVATASTPFPVPSNTFIDVTGISFDDNSTVYMKVGETYQLNAIVSPSNATYKEVNWYYNSDPSVATVDQNGVVTAKKEGYTYVSAATYNYTYSTEVRKILVTNGNNPGGSDPDDLDPYINVEQNTYDILVGETVVVVARTNHGGHTGYTVRNGSCIQILSRDTAYENGEHVERVSIKGLKAGTAVIEFSNNYSGTITNPVTINVREDSSATTPIETLYSIIESSGYVNGNGDKTISYSISDEYTTYFINHTDGVELVFVQQSDSANTYSTMTIPLSNVGRLDAEVDIGSSAFNSSINPSTYTKNTNLTFLGSNGSAPVEAVQNLLNSTFKAAMSGWNMALLYNFGIQLSDIGFVNY